MAETTKMFSRRCCEGFFERYIRGRVIDIGCGDDPITRDCVKWDLIHGQGDATFMEGVTQATYDTVHASHVLEHITDYQEAIRNWWRILKPGGYLIVVVPHRDLYEKRLDLPSRWNGDHKHFWLPVLGDLPKTHGVMSAFMFAMGIQQFRTAFHSLRVLDYGHTITDPEQHSDGEYSIELILKKPAIPLK